jgi:hypothetical protein
MGVRVELSASHSLRLKAEIPKSFFFLEGENFRAKWVGVWILAIFGFPVCVLKD